ncbi:hypothetical protein OQA88_8127 [Cercophora sp. LCS_1]
MTEFNRGWLLILFSTLLVVDQSRGHSVFVLRTISELTGLALSATISNTWERVKWALVCRDSDASFLDFLALDEGTKVLSLLGLATGAKGPSAETRLWSAARLSSIIIIPITGILVMSQVEIQLAFAREKHQESYLGYALHPMNASMAIEYFGFSDLILTSNIGGFLYNPARSVNLSPQGEQGTFCRLNADADGPPSDCRRSYFVAGETLYTTPDLLNDPSFPKASIILATDHRGFQLDFDAGDSHMEFDPDKECRTYSSRYWWAPAGAVRLCVGSSGPNELQARLVSCPGSIAATQSCNNDTSWHNNVDWTIKMSAYFRNATLAYSRSNGTIVWHSFTDAPAVPVDITPAEILQTYDTMLLDTSTFFAKNGSEPPPFSSSTFATYLWMTEPVFSGQNATNPATMNGVFSGLQALLAMPLYLCQNGLARRMLPVALDAKSIADADGLDSIFSLLSPLPERSSPASFAYYRYQVVASTPTLIAYSVLSAVTLVLCCIAHILSGLACKGNQRTPSPRGPKLSSFAALDLFAHCSIEDERHFVVYQGRSSTFHYQTAHSNQRQWLSTLRVRWSGAAITEDALHLVATQPRRKSDTNPGGDSPYHNSQEFIATPTTARYLTLPR